MSDVIVNFEGRIAIITLNRPIVLNALTSNLCRELIDVFISLDTNPEIRTVILTGAGRAFCSGADIEEMSTKSSIQAYQFLKLIRNTFLEIENYSFPVIAAVNGVALGGGCELALACDLRLAATNAKFAFPEMDLGIMPTGGGTQRLPRLIGMTRAKEMIFTGCDISAKQAFEIGLVNRVLENNQLLSEAIRIARIISEKSPMTLKLAKASLRTVWDAGLNVGLNFEIGHGSLLWSTDDQKEGMAAFVEKRKPEFKGK